MTDYMILLPDDEDRWEATKEAEKQAVYARHEEFTKLLAERGHRMKGGAELSHSRTAKTVRSVDGRVSVTDGPYAESVEQLSGYYLVESDDLDDLLQICGTLADVEPLEVRALASGGDS